LYAVAHIKFCIILSYVALSKIIIAKISNGLLLTRIISAVSAAIIVPEQIAMPTSAPASTGAHRLSLLRNQLFL